MYTLITGIILLLIIAMDETLSQKVCPLGFMGSSCERTCTEGFWGLGCASQCNCQSPCDPVDGHCGNRCDHGYYGPTCQRQCEDYTYGPGISSGCLHSCSWCVTPCDKVTGHCTTGCGPGYIHNVIDHFCERCPQHTWGDNCTNHCRCQNEKEPCDRATGACPSGCADWFGGTGCNVTLPRITSTTLPVITVVHGNDVILMFKQSGLPGINVIYEVQLRIPGNDTWVHSDCRVKHISGEITGLIKCTLSESSTYEVRIMPFVWIGETFVPGESSPHVTVTTHMAVHDHNFNLYLIIGVCILAVLLTAALLFAIILVVKYKILLNCSKQIDPTDVNVEHCPANYRPGNSLQNRKGSQQSEYYNTLEFETKCSKKELKHTSNVNNTYLE